MQIACFHCVTVTSSALVGEGEGEEEDEEEEEEEFEARKSVTTNPIQPDRGPIGQKKIGDCLFFSYMFDVFYGILGVYIFPKWLKKVPGHIPILFR